MKREKKTKAMLKRLNAGLRRNAELIRNIDDLFRRLIDTYKVSR